MLSGRGIEKEALIAISGAYGFIGSALVGMLNELGYTNLLLIDDFSKTQKAANLAGKQFAEQIDRFDFWEWVQRHGDAIRYFFHLGARTDTTERDEALLARLNVNYSKKVWRLCSEQQIPLVYASSAATYGGGELGYKDDEALVDQLQPLNAYGVSKNEFDCWAVREERHPPFWAGLKFFNVYGPNEYHKERMASVILHAFRQIKERGSVKLFRSHVPEYKDGGQLRDFIYVKDVLKVCLWLMTHQPASGLYNVGTGGARSFHDLAVAAFNALHLPVRIDFIDTPLDIRDKYQYFTEADMTKLRLAGYKDVFTSLEAGVSDYVTHYLQEHRYL